MDSKWKRSRWCGAHRYLPVFCSFQHISPGSLQQRTGYIPSSLAVSSVHSISPLPCDLFNYFYPSLPFCRSLRAVVTAGCPCIDCVLNGWMDGGTFLQDRAALLEALIEMGGTDKRRELLQHRRMFCYSAWLCSALFAYPLYYFTLSPCSLSLSLSLPLSSIRQGVAGSPESRWQTAEGLCGKHGAECEGD